MRGLFALGAVIARRRDDAHAEMMLPKTIDHDAGRQRMFFARQPAGQSGSPSR